ncbi:hypothetical protein [Clostridium thermobutyricum]|uniref:Uncharacterized protein n=1 Tax=Clostridium thermobutyricum DSM 4928 TaxID=1121339 RepID=A0A1V4SXG1_9CLOT|nr:hypothetical protein [Clostridium thermobutyricum]OPX48589.1 hypothetical protein CLTHE_11200 [Clostridium thermobutyricum DSM 4928]
MIIELNDKKIEESLNHLGKAIEIVGGEFQIEDREVLVSQIIRNLFEKGSATIEILGKEYSIEELFLKKTEFEKYYLKNKIKTVRSIVEKIKKYNTELEGKIRKFKKINSIELLREINEEIEKRYKWEFDKFLLVNIENRDQEKNYYGSYLGEKKKQLIDSILVKLGI